jgi:predicted TIM-barrel fold metal-dependent hydrolase
LTQLLETYENLYIDTSVGYYLRWADELSEADRAAYNAFVTKHSGRLLFGSDTDLTPTGPDEYDVQGFLCHARFVSKLQLDCDTLQDIAWRNAARLYKLPVLNPQRRGNVRP